MLNAAAEPTNAGSIGNLISTCIAVFHRVEETMPHDGGDAKQKAGGCLTAIGFEEVEVTSRTKDGGIDVRGTLVTSSARAWQSR